MGPKDAEDGTPGKTEYVVGEFNCSCVGISKFQAVCGGDKSLADVPDEDYFDAVELTNLMGIKAIEMLDKAKAEQKAALIKKVAMVALGIGAAAIFVKMLRR